MNSHYSQAMRALMIALLTWDLTLDITNVAMLPG